LVIECGLQRARACFESQLKNLDFWGTIAKNQKSGQIRVYLKVATQLQRLCGRSNFPAIDSAKSPVRFLNLESILPLKMVYVYFPAIVLKMTSRTPARYGKLTNV